MEKLVRYGLLLLIVLMIGLLIINTQIVYANEEEAATEENYTPEEKDAAIIAANNAMLRIPPLQQIVSLDQVAVTYVAEARALVDKAKESYDAIDSDFPGIYSLIEAEQRISKFLAVKAAQDAIDAITSDSELTEEYKAAVEEARRLVDIAMREYDATYFDICWRYEALLDAEKKLEEEPEAEPEPKPEKPDDRLPTPPTGGFSIALAVGLIFSGAGMLLIKKRYKG